MEDKLRVGVITATHGLKGEVKVFPTTDRPGRYDTLQEVLLWDGRTYRPLKIVSHRYFKQMVILRFAGLDTIEAVEPFVRRELYVTRELADPLQENEYYIADLLGMQVLDERGKTLGTVKDVLQTGANDVYVVQTREGELLIPAIRQCILQVDVAAQVMRVHLLEGL